MGLVFVSLCGAYLFRPVYPENLADDEYSQNLLHEHWNKGDMIVLVRHAERCDHSSAPCLSDPEGITVRAQDEARDLGQNFAKLGLAATDIYSSPITRAAQTAALMFGGQPAQQDWLTMQCKGSMLRDALKHKVPHRNLILVTHSECIKDLESSVSAMDPETPEYASSLFLVADGKSTSRVLGYLDADEWGQMIRIR